MIVVLWGEDKSCKTTFALTFPKPLVIMELDIGGFDRAKYRFKKEIDAGLIRYEPFIVPFQIGNFDPANLTVRPSKIVVGMKELFYQFVGKFIQHMTDDTATIVVDTGTLLYDITCEGYKQEKQELQLPLRPDGMGSDGKPLRTILQPVEYREPYLRLRGIAYQAKSHKKHLVVTHHAADEYDATLQKDGTIANARTGKRELHGWGQWGDSADVILRTYWQKAVIDPKTKEEITPAGPYCNIELAEIKQLEGMVIDEPNFDKIDQMIKFFHEQVNNPASKSGILE